MKNRFFPKKLGFILTENERNYLFPKLVSKEEELKVNRTVFESTSTLERIPTATDMKNPYFGEVPI
jgi:hypothetical protein